MSNKNENATVSKSKKLFGSKPSSSFLGDKKQQRCDIEWWKWKLDHSLLIHDEWIGVEHSAWRGDAHAVEASTLGFDFEFLVKWSSRHILLMISLFFLKVSDTESGKYRSGVSWHVVTHLFREVVQTFCAQLGGKQYTSTLRVLFIFLCPKIGKGIKIHCGSLSLVRNAF